MCIRDSVKFVDFELVSRPLIDWGYLNTTAEFQRCISFLSNLTSGWKREKISIWPHLTALPVKSNATLKRRADFLFSDAGPLIGLHYRLVDRVCCAAPCSCTVGRSGWRRTADGRGKGRLSQCSAATANKRVRWPSTRRREGRGDGSIAGSHRCPAGGQSWTWTWTWAEEYPATDRSKFRVRPRSTACNGQLLHFIFILCRLLLITSK